MLLLALRDKHSVKHDNLCICICLQTHGIEIIGSKLMDVRLISSLAVCAMLAIALIGTEWESKVNTLQFN